MHYIQKYFLSAKKSQSVDFGLQVDSMQVRAIASSWSWHLSGPLNPGRYLKLLSWELMWNATVQCRLYLLQFMVCVCVPYIHLI